MDADEILRLLSRLGERGDRQVEVLEAKITSRRARPALLGRFLLHPAILDTASTTSRSLQRRIVGAGVDARQQRVAVGAFGAPLAIWLEISFSECALPLSADSWSRSISATSSPALAAT